MQIIDTHSHLYLDDFLNPKSESDRPLDQILQEAAEAGISDILLPSIELDSISQMNRLIAFSKDLELKDVSGVMLNAIRFHKMAGIHPCEFKPGDQCPELLFELCEQSDIVAIGETGLDGYWSREAIKEQKESLRIHCAIAKATGKPIVLHNRDTTKELLDLIDEEQDGRLRGVWHCFTGTLEEGKRALDLGLYLGIGGVVTFKNAGVAEVVARLSLDRMILETDSPYLAPVPYRGKRNEPVYMLKTAEKLAEIHEREVSEIAQITTQNAVDLFGIQT